MPTQYVIMLIATLAECVGAVDIVVLVFPVLWVGDIETAATMQVSYLRSLKHHTWWPRNVSSLLLSVSALLIVQVLKQDTGLVIPRWVGRIFVLYSVVLLVVLAMPWSNDTSILIWLLFSLIHYDLVMTSLSISSQTAAWLPYPLSLPDCRSVPQLHQISDQFSALHTTPNYPKVAG